jgi:hypothetical protein
MSNHPNHPKQPALQLIYCHDPSDPKCELPPINKHVLAVQRILDRGQWRGRLLPAVLIEDPYDPSHTFWVTAQGGAHKIQPFAWLAFDESTLDEHTFLLIAQMGRLPL